jgi:hypothetical protein
VVGAAERPAASCAVVEHARVGAEVTPRVGRGVSHCERREPNPFVDGRRRVIGTAIGTPEPGLAVGLDGQTGVKHRRVDGGGVGSLRDEDVDIVG